MGASEDILEAFLHEEALSFAQIQHKIGLRSNHLAYHLNKLVEEGLLERDDNGYRLSSDSEQTIPYMNSRHSPLPVVLVGLWRDGKVLMHKRDKRPYKDKWSMLGGRIFVEESLDDAAKRIAKKLSGAEIKNITLQTVAHEHTVKDEEITHSFILFYVSAETADHIEDRENRRWFFPEDLNEQETIHSDYILANDKEHPNFMTFETSD